MMMILMRGFFMRWWRLIIILFTIFKMKTLRSRGDWTNYIYHITYQPSHHLLSHQPSQPFHQPCHHLPSHNKNKLWMMWRRRIDHTTTCHFIGWWRLLLIWRRRLMRWLKVRWRRMNFKSIYTRDIWLRNFWWDQLLKFEIWDFDVWELRWLDELRWKDENWNQSSHLHSLISISHIPFSHYISFNLSISITNLIKKLKTSEYKSKNKCEKVVPK